MGYKTPAELATQRYHVALTRLRHARQAYVDAQVPMDPVDGRPPALTHEQGSAVWEYAIAWGEFARAAHAVAASGASRRPVPRPPH